MFSYFSAALFGVCIHTHTLAYGMFSRRAFAPALSEIRRPWLLKDSTPLGVGDKHLFIVKDIV